MNNKYFILTNNKKNYYIRFKEYLLDLDDTKYDSSYFNFTHMNRYGSQIFTKAWLNEYDFLIKIENK